MMGPLYAGSLVGRGPLDVVYPDGSRVAVPVDDWCGPLRPGDESLLSRCTGATLDIGCGPGRLTVALRHRGVAAAGIDASPAAVRLAREAGALAWCRSVFDALPREGRWDTAVLADGCIGIGGVPVVLLRRVAEVLGPRGQALVEVDGPSARSGPVRLRLAVGGRLGRPFRWAHLAVGDVPEVAAAAGLTVTDRWEEAGRWFVALTPGAARCGARG
jgi:SAM-dependent methyltransferase